MNCRTFSQNSRSRGKSHCKKTVAWDNSFWLYRAFALAQDQPVDACCNNLVVVNSLQPRRASLRRPQRDRRMLPTPRPLSILHPQPHHQVPLPQPKGVDT